MKTTKALATGVSLIALLSATTASAETLADIEAAAKKEGMLTTIALPHDWCNYGEIIASFKAKYPEITVNELNPDAGSADELEAIRANKDNTGPQAPDVVPPPRDQIPRHVPKCTLHLIGEFLTKAA